MNSHTRREFFSYACLLGAATQALAENALQQSGAKKDFRVFDGLLYSPMPDLRSFGMNKLLSAGNLWRPNVSHQEVDPAGIQAAVRFIHRFTENYYFDLEEWPVSGAPQPIIDASIAKLAQTADIARQTAPQMKFGFYNVAPQGTYWPIMPNRTDALAEWHDINKRSAVVAAKADFLFPSLYTFYDDPAGWELAARAVLKEARQYGKPVYPFLWPEFHDSNVRLKGTRISRDFWRRELEVCRECADGLVLWGGFKQFWDEQADWWVETKAFVQSLGAQT